jgi:hypothetical protein
MSHATSAPPATAAAQAGALAPNDLGRRLARSHAFATLLATGLPTLGLLVCLVAGLPPFAALMAACFLLAAAVVCRDALAAFAGRTLRLLVTARVVLVAVVAAVLFCAEGGARMAVVAAVLLWLTADRLLGRHALHDLRKLAGGRK